MKNKAFNWLACTAILLLLVSVGALAADDQGTLAGVFNDFTPAGTTGPWELHGQWWLKTNGKSGKRRLFSGVDYGTFRPRRNADRR